MRWWLKLILIVAAFAIGLSFTFTGGNIRPNIGFLGLDGYDRGAAYPGALISAFMPGPVQTDLIQRGLLSLDTSSDSSSGSKIDIGAIENLIKSGIYFIDPRNRLELGPVTIPAEIQQLQSSPAYRYSQRRTQTWSFLDNFNYTGVDVYVTMPAGIELASGGETSHNIYCVHLTLPDGRWVESGVGWVNWTASPIIYTYQSYTGQWTVENIPGGTPRDINLKVEISTDRVAEMYVFDPHSSKSITTRQSVGGLGHVVDLTQEQHSNSSRWIDTPVVRFFDSMIKIAGNDE